MKKSFVYALAAAVLMSSVFSCEIICPDNGVEDGTEVTPTPDPDQSPDNDPDATPDQTPETDPDLVPEPDLLHIMSRFRRTIRIGPATILLRTQLVLL